MKAMARAPRPVHAAVVHHSMNVGEVTLPVLAIRPVAKVRHHVWRDGVLSLFLALGLSVAFLSPFRYSAQVAQAQPGRVLGQSITVPLHVDVTVQQNDQTWRVTTYPATGSIAQALAQAAGTRQGSLDYLGRGSSMYLRGYLGVMNDTSGQWAVRVNGEHITDLSQRQLMQGDGIVISWEAR